MCAKIASAYSYGHTCKLAFRSYQRHVSHTIEPGRQVHQYACWRPQGQPPHMVRISSLVLYAKHQHGGAQCLPISSTFTCSSLHMLLHSTHVPPCGVVQERMRAYFSVMDVGSSLPRRVAMRLGVRLPPYIDIYMSMSMSIDCLSTCT